MKNQKSKAQIKNTKKIVILYHNNCPDGFGAAWAAWKKFGNKAKYIGVNHTEAPPPGLRGKEIFLVDFCYGESDTRRIQNRAKSLTVIDHHISRKNIALSVPDHRYASNHSGSVLAWKYFHPKKKVPRLLRYIEDVDLWRFVLPRARELNAFLDMRLTFSFQSFNALVQRFENRKSRNQFAHEGEIILEYQNVLVDDAMKNSAERVRFLGHTVLAVNSPFIHSEIGNALAIQRGSFSIVWSKKYGKIVVSLRSIGNFDVSKLAARYGGGGHKNAAGFSFPFNKKFPWKEIRAKK